MIIYARSPYFVIINETAQVGSMIEIRIWNNPDIKPVDANYTFTKSIASTTKRENVYNISPYVREYIEAIAPSYATDGLWCNVEVKLWKETSVGSYTSLGTLTGYATSGYTLYSDGINGAEETFLNFNVLTKPNIIYNYEEGIAEEKYPFFNVIANTTSPAEIIVTYKDLRGRNSNSVIYDTSSLTMYKIPFRTNSIKYDKGNTIDIAFRSTGEYVDYTSSFTILPICEPKYTPVQCQYINRYGGWQFLTFYKAQSNNIQSQGTTYKLMPSGVDYDTKSAQTKSFNINGSQNVKLNTGWISEDYNDLIQDLLLAETILLDEVPVEIVTSSTDLKTSLRDRNINYEIEFQYAFNLVNTVV